MNLQAMQVVATKDGKGVLRRVKPADTNVKAMAMGSWHASLSRGGELSAKKRARLKKGAGDGSGAVGTKKGGKK
jgi:hypothetical protein